MMTDEQEKKLFATVTDDQRTRAAVALADAQKLCERLIERDLKQLGQPLYLADHPEGLPRARNVGGYAGNDLSVTLELKRRGQWRGPGPMAVVDCEFQALSESYYNPNNDPYSWHTLERLIPLIAIHEVGHLVPLVKQADASEEQSQYSEIEQLCLGFFQAKQWRESSATKEHKAADKAAPWHPCHGLEFTRSLVHLHARASWLGYCFSMDDLRFAGPRYGLSPALRYMEALGDEPRRMSACTFDEIHATKPPKAFSQLFRRDVLAYLRNQQKETANAGRT